MLMMGGPWQFTAASRSTINPTRDWEEIDWRIPVTDFQPILIWFKALSASTSYQNQLNEPIQSILDLFTAQSNDQPWFIWLDLWIDILYTHSNPSAFPFIYFQLLWKIKKYCLCIWNEKKKQFVTYLFKELNKMCVNFTNCLSS